MRAKQIDGCTHTRCQFFCCVAVQDQGLIRLDQIAGALRSWLPYINGSSLLNRFGGAANAVLALEAVPAR